MPGIKPRIYNLEYSQILLVSYGFSIVLELVLQQAFAEEIPKESRGSCSSESSANNDAAIEPLGVIYMTCLMEEPEKKSSDKLTGLFLGKAAFRTSNECFCLANTIR